MKKLDYLESLRGVAALVVVFAHFVVGFYPSLWWTKPEEVHSLNAIELLVSVTPLNLAYNGSFSVCIFFVLSGFVLTYKFFRDQNSRIALVPIAVKRYTRLLFPILLSNTIAYLILKLSLFYNVPASLLTKSGWLGLFWKFEPSLKRMLYESFIGAYFTKGITYNNILWTMSYEFYGSMLVYACIAVFGRHPKRDWLYAALILFYRHSFNLAFILGMVLSDIVTRERNIFLSIRHKGYYVAILLIGLFIGSFPVDRPVTGTIYEGLAGFARIRTYQITGAFLVMIALLNSRRLQTLFSKRPFLFLGRISFSIYALHLLIIGSLSCFILLQAAPTMSYHAAFLASFALSLPVMLVASHYFYRFVDAQGIRASQIVYQKALNLMKSLAETMGRILPTFFTRNRIFELLIHPIQSVAALNKKQ